MMFLIGMEWTHFSMYQLPFAGKTHLKLQITAIYLAPNSADYLGGLLILALLVPGLLVCLVSLQTGGFDNGLGWDNWGLCSHGLLTSSRLF